MAELTEWQKHEIVSMLACFCEPKSTIAHFRSAHGIDLDHKQVGRYDPHRTYYERGEKWRAIFEAQGTKFLSDVAAVPISHLGYRLNILQEGIDAARYESNWRLVARLLEQAAKEMGGLYTSQRSLQIVPDEPKRPADMSPEERHAALTEVIRRAQEKNKADRAN
jgi:hypothetical protein